MFASIAEGSIVLVRMTITQLKSATERNLRLQELDHFTVPIRDFNVARKFYSEVLGGIVTQEPLWYRVASESRKGIAAGAHAAVQLFAGAGHLVLYYQPWGQPGPHQVHPCRVFAAHSPEQMDELIVRLEHVNVPYVLMTPQTAPGAVKARARLYFRDPDGNQLSVECTSYPMSDRVHVGPFDSSLQAYQWREWRAMVPDGGGPPSDFATGQRSEGSSGATAPGARWQRRERYGSVEGPWSVDGVHQFTLPVRALEKAEQFYSQVLGAEVVEREAVEIGERQQEALRVSACPGVKLALVQQEYGWLPPDTSNPHWGFAISAADVETWLEHFAQWNIPCALIVRREYVVPMGVPTRVELHVLDPDGNQIELVAWDYPLSDRVERSRYNPWRLTYPYDSWPANT